MTDTPTRQVESVPIDYLEPWPGNPRIHDIAVIADSLRAHGQYRPILVQASTNRIIAGHGTVEAAVSVGWTHVDVIRLDVDDEQARRILLVDNRSNDLAAYDDAALMALLNELDGDYAGTGFDAEAYGLLLQSLTEGGYGAVRQGQEPGERANEYEAADLRSIVLPYPTATFDTMVEALGVLRRALDLDTNAGVIYQLVIEAVRQVETEP